MNTKSLSAAFAACAAVLAASPALAACEFSKLGDIKVDHKRGPPMIEIEVNGKTGLMALDTSAFSTMMTSTGAAALGIGPGQNLDGMTVVSTTGKEIQTTVKMLSNITLGSTFRVSQLPVLIMPSTAQSDVIGAIGVDILAASDVEFDLANGRITLFRTKGCGKDSLAYWTDTYSTADLRRSANNRIQTVVTLNGRPLTAQIASGRATSVVDQAGAAAAGVRPGGEGVEAMGASFGGGRPAWTGTFESFAVGQEQIKNVRLPFTDLWGRTLTSGTGSNVRQRIDDLPSLVLGLDFLRAHRVLIANSQGKMYFSYNGGPIFAKPETQAAPAAQK